jgi:hypothetical protein
LLCSLLYSLESILRFVAFYLLLLFLNNLSVVYPDTISSSSSFSYSVSDSRVLFNLDKTAYSFSYCLWFVRGEEPLATVMTRWESWWAEVDDWREMERENFLILKPFYSPVLGCSIVLLTFSVA